MLLRHTLAPLVDLVYPPRCPLCGEGIAAQTGLCLSCWGELAFPRGPSSDDIGAGVLYNDAARKLVLAFKYGRKIALAPMLARLMLARISPMDTGFALVPVPLHRWRLWHRGFNQSALLAEHLARAMGGELLVDGLIRHRRTPPLSGLSREERHKVLAGAIAINPRRAAQLAGRDVLLVDDVFTSGATTGACTQALLAAGARKVRIACFAKVDEPG